jgi:hypothetical protein
MGGDWALPRSGVYFKLALKRETSMARKTNPPPRKSVILSVEDMRAGLTKIGRRISELESFDFSTVHERGDSNISALTKKVNSTLQEILGVDSVEYNEYFTASMDTLPLIMSRRWSSHEIQEGYKKGLSERLQS